MLIRIFLIVFGLGFLVTGLSNLSVCLKEPEITETDIRNLHAIRNHRRVRVTGGVLDAYDSTGNYLVRGRHLHTIYLPYVPPGRTDRDPVTVVLVTRDRDLKDAFRKFITSGDSDHDSRRTLAAYSDFERLAATRHSIQGLVAGDYDLRNLRKDVGKTVPNLSGDFIVIEDGKDASLFTGLACLASAAFAALVAWIIRPEKR